MKYMIMYIWCTRNTNLELLSTVCYLHMCNTTQLKIPQTVKGKLLKSRPPRSMQLQIPNFGFNLAWSQQSCGDVTTDYPKPYSNAFYSNNLDKRDHKSGGNSSAGPSDVSNALNTWAPLDVLFLSCQAQPKIAAAVLPPSWLSYAYG